MILNHPGISNIHNFINPWKQDIVGGHWGRVNSTGAEQHQLHKFPRFMQNENGEGQCQKLLKIDMVTVEY